METLIMFLRAATDFDIFGTDNAGEVVTCGFQYPLSSISILHFVARSFGRKLYNFALLMLEIVVNIEIYRPFSPL
jgi:hypothetical protein